MQVTNCSNQNFKALSFTPNALKSLSKRMPSGKFISEQEKLINMYKDSPLDIVVDTISQESTRLCAKVKLGSLDNKLQNIIPQYFEESILSSVFNKTEKFFETLCKKIDKKETFLLGKTSRTKC